MSLPTPYYDYGGITIFHGDCLEILPHLPKAKGKIQSCSLITDPPYGIDNRSNRGGKHKKCVIANDLNVATRDEALRRAVFDRALVFGSWKAPRPLGVRQVLIWEKGGHTGMGDLGIPWKPNFEEIYVLGTGFMGKRTSGILYYLSGRECQGIISERNHPTEKPIMLMIELVSKSPGVILDPFMGSGTTLRAAKDLGRHAIGIEIEEKYCEIAAKRLGQEVLDFG
jgi:site-specific DNA-methyltransferase (adenine-specific)